MRLWNVWLTRIVLAAAILYPPLELFVWTPVVMKIYCPKPDSNTPSPEQRLEPYSGARSLLIISDSERSASNLSRTLLRLNGSLDKVVLPVSRIVPLELRQHLSQLGQGQRFVEFAEVSVADPACAANRRDLEHALGVLPESERRQAADILESMKKQELCATIELSATAGADYYVIESDSTVETVAGVFTLFTSTGAPLDSDAGSARISRGGRLAPELPVTWFISRLLSNGDVACPI